MTDFEFLHGFLETLDATLFILIRDDFFGGFLIEFLSIFPEGIDIPRGNSVFPVLQETVSGCARQGFAI